MTWLDGAVRWSSPGEQLCFSAGSGSFASVGEIEISDEISSARIESIESSEACRERKNVDGVCLGFEREARGLGPETGLGPERKERGLGPGRGEYGGPLLPCSWISEVDDLERRRWGRSLPHLEAETDLALPLPLEESGEVGEGGRGRPNEFSIPPAGSSSPVWRHELGCPAGVWRRLELVALHDAFHELGTELGCPTCPCAGARGPRAGQGDAFHELGTELGCPTCSCPGTRCTGRLEPEAVLDTGREEPLLEEPGLHPKMLPKLALRCSAMLDGRAMEDPLCREDIFEEAERVREDSLEESPASPA